MYTRKVAHVLLVIVYFVVPLLSCCAAHWNGGCGSDCNVMVETCFHDPDSVGSDSSCHSQCFDSLTHAIGYIQQQQHHRVSVTLLLCSQRLGLERGPNNTINNSYIEKLDLTSANGTVVSCSSEASIVLSGKMSVRVQGIAFVGCNTSGTLRFVNHDGPNVTLVNLSLKQSGLSFINVTGYVNVSNTNISELAAFSGLYVFSQLPPTTKLFFSLTNCHFMNNTAINGTTRGGGMLISLKETRNSNYFSIANCTFADNRAYLGGALSVRASAAGNTSVMIYDSVFHKNKAEIGSAIDLYCSQTPVHQQIRESCLKVEIRGSNLSQNEPLHEILQMHSSTVSIKHVELQLNGRISFDSNNGSAISSDESDISVNVNVSVTFIGNLAHRGAGLNLANSFVHIYRNTDIRFLNNRAIIAGGAIYSNQRLDTYIPYSRDCFIQYNDNDCGQENSCNPDNWNTSLTFENNQALEGRTIFTVSVYPCLWKSPNTTKKEDIEAAFCTWKPWHINCTQGDIATSPSMFQHKSYKLNGIVSGLPVPYNSLNLSVCDELENNVTSHTIFTMLPAESSHSLIVAPNYNGSIVVFGKGPRTEDWYIQTVGERTITAAMTIEMMACPPGFRYEEKAKDCECRESLHTIIHCFPNKTALIQVAYCISYLNDDLHSHKTVVYGRCIFTTGKTADSGPSPFTSLPQYKDAVGRFCRRLNREGLLCGNCINNHSVDVFSDSFRCRKCQGSLLDWVIFVLVESIPIFVLFTAVVVLHISLTSGPVNGYIFCCQVVTVTIEVIFTKTSLEKTSVKYPYAMTNFLLIPSNVWSLDFFRIYKLFANDRPTCLGENLKVMHILALRYLSAFYPLLFLIITCILIELHARNCRCLVRLWNPVGYVVSRFRRTWDIRTSLVDAFAAFILLSYVKIIRVSLLLSTYNIVYDMNANRLKNVLHYDPTIPFASTTHIPFMVLGIFLLFTFGLFFPLLLFFYQFHFLQRCLHTLKINRNGLRIFMDAFQGCYKDGKNNGPDRRFFAGLYFVFRLLVFGTFNLFWDNKELYVTLQSLMILFAMVTAALRPYKRELYNIMDTIFFCVLGVAFGLHVYVFDKAETSLKIPESAVYIAYVLELIPFLYVTCYMAVWIGKRLFNPNKCGYSSLYAPIDNSISWRFNDSEEIISQGVPSHSKSVCTTSLSLSGTQEHKSERQRRSMVSTSLADTSSYGSIN